MCIGVPCQITHIDEKKPNLALAQVNGISREIDISLISRDTVPSLIGQWVLVHVGFAMSLLNEQEALLTLEALNAMQEEEPDVGVLFSSSE